MPTPTSRCFLALCVLALPAVMLGCQSHILRENVLATTSSMLGLSLEQNLQTQAHEVKLGYSRSEFFFVPTSKRIVTDKNYHDAAGVHATSTMVHSDRAAILQQIKSMEDTDPSRTPEVLAEIQVGGAAGQGTGPEARSTVTIRQRLAVGKTAVQSDAAVALMSGSRRAPFESALQSDGARDFVLRHTTVAIHAIGAARAANMTQQVDKFDALARTIDVPRFRRASITPPATEGSRCLTLTDAPDLNVFSNAEDAIELLGNLEASMLVIDDALGHLAKASADAIPLCAEPTRQVTASELRSIRATQARQRDSLALALFATPEYEAVLASLTR